MTTPTSDDILDGMARTLAFPVRWSKGFGARDRDGLPVDPCSPCAMSWCMYGSLDRAVGPIADAGLRQSLANEAEARVLLVLRKNFGLTAIESLSQFNDDRATTHADVRQVLDLARRTPLTGSEGEGEGDPLDEA